ncbi:MAG: translation initiation factor IF-2 [Sphingobacteriales bacterium]|jgi:translation initiation factor IF-2
MSDKQSVRLSKVAKELNIGASTITEFLAGKGHEVENKPTTKIAGDLYDLLLNEFQDEKVLKEKSQKVNIGKVERENVEIDENDHSRPHAKKEDSQEFLIKNVTTKSFTQSEDKPAVKPQAKPVETPADKPTSNVKVIGKIDLNAKPKKKEAPVAETPKVEEKKVEEAPKAETKKEEAPKVEEKKVEETPKAEAKKEETPPSEEKETPKVVAKAEPTKEVKAEEKPKEEVKPAAETEKKVEESTEVKKEEAKPAAKVDQTIRAPKNKLSGPNIIGKIVLPEKPKPVASSRKDAEAENKRKRKRKRTDGPGATPGAGTAGTARPASAGNDRPRRPAQRGKYSKPEPKGELTDKEVQDQIKATLARLSGGSKQAKVSNRAKYRKQKRDDVALNIEDLQRAAEEEEKFIKVTEFVTVSELANMMDVGSTDVISACLSLGIITSINQRLDAETLSIVAEEFGFNVEFVSADVQESIIEEIEDDPKDLVPRAPIVTVMGHVDHGKTSLLDYVRNANVIKGEAGGITQHIGAYEVIVPGDKRITFLDTPGHEAFTAMRARGAQVTDIVIIVIAADDRVMPQTKEAINHAQAAGVPMIFALNKIDREGANPDRIKEELSAMDLLVEEWGGKYQCQEISAKVGTNVNELLEKVLLEAELLELKANPNRLAKGTVVEATLDKGRGITTTILVETGTLKVGDPILAGCYAGRVKAMFNERGVAVQEAGPSTPVQMLGMSGTPQAGDNFHAMETEQEAKEIANKRMQLQREQGLRTQKHITLDEIGRRLAVGNFKELNVIVKGDVDGSVEALSDSLIKLSTEEIQVNVIHKSVGQISESDVLLATASDAIIIGFQVRPSPTARKLAENEKIDIRLYSIIYAAIEELKSAMEGMLSPEIKEEITGNVEVRDVFKITKVGTVAGCYVLDGKIARDSEIRLIRDGVVVYTGEIWNLKRFKEDVKEVATSYECGLSIKNFNDIKVGDVLEVYKQVEIQRTL